MLQQARNLDEVLPGSMIRILWYCNGHFTRTVIVIFVATARISSAH